MRGERRRDGDRLRRWCGGRGTFGSGNPLVAATILCGVLYPLYARRVLFRLEAPPETASADVDASDRATTTHVRTVHRIEDDVPSADEIADADGSDRATTTKTNLRTIHRIEYDVPSADDIATILTSEQLLLPSRDRIDDDAILAAARFYELTYAFVSAFRRAGVPMLIGAGSHIGARRHHGMIPSAFGEKDVDFEVFSTDEEKVSSIIEGVLRSRPDWPSAVPLLETDFGYQLPQEAMTERGFAHYVDFWLWSEGEDDDRIRCVGRKVPEHEYGGTSGCDKWFRTFTGEPPPAFERGDHFPPVYQVFGTHRVPIPRTTAELETFEYAGHVEHWNATCGNHRRWSDADGTWLAVPREGRECRRFHRDVPFVFATGDGGAEEELRRGDVVLHRTEAPTS